MNFYYYGCLLSFLTFIKLAKSLQFIDKYLTKSQWSLIDCLLINPNTTNNMKYKIYNILFKYYEQWAFTKAYQFKRLHKYKCKHISTLELNNYASFGLYKSICKYNANYKYPFIHFAEKYVNYELLYGLTNLYPISSTSKSIRKKGYNIERKNISYVQFLGKEDWILEKRKKIEETEPIFIILKNEKLMEMWEKIHQLNAFQKRIIFLKFNFYFDKIRSNKEISLLMGCSEEWIRQNINIILKKLEFNNSMK